MIIGIFSLLALVFHLRVFAVYMAW